MVQGMGHQTPIAYPLKLTGRLVLNRPLLALPLGVVLMLNMTNPHGCKVYLWVLELESCRERVCPCTHGVLNTKCVRAHASRRDPKRGYN